MIFSERPRILKNRFVVTLGAIPRAASRCGVSHRHCRLGQELAQSLTRGRHRCLQLGVFFLLLVGLVESSPAQTPVLTETFKLFRPDGFHSDNFSDSVAISGDRVVVGAPEVDIYRTGTAYFYDATTAMELHQVSPEPAARQFEPNHLKFGDAVSLDGNTVLVGASEDLAFDRDEGAAYIYDFATGNQVRKLTASDSDNGDEFGISVAVEGNVAVVGAPGNEDETGAAYVYDVTIGNQLFKLVGSDVGEGDLFGRSIDISGNLAIVGAVPKISIVGGIDVGVGAAYVFDLTTGAELRKLTADNPEMAYRFGESVAIDGDLAIVGAQLDGLDLEDPSKDYFGAAYIFDVPSGEELHRLSPIDGRNDEVFGFSVAIDDNLAVVGAPDAGRYSTGRAYVYDVTSGSELFLLDRTGPQFSAERFGSSVDIDGNRVIVGDSRSSGAAYLYVVPEPTALHLALLGIVTSLAFTIRRKRSRCTNQMLAATVAVASLFGSQRASATNISIDTVPVGNAGNLPDDTGIGAVAYEYRIGTTEVTNAQYAAFLNAKAASDPFGLWENGMSLTYGGIVRGGSSGSFNYTLKPGRENMPVNYVNWTDAIRFTNWLHNGQGSGDTETGSYTLGALDANGRPVDIVGITRNPGATWFLPTEDEWYKAAYHKNDGDTANYFEYPTSSDSVPYPELPAGGSNSANFSRAVGDLTEAGAYVDSYSPYGTFDQAGNVSEWNESLAYGPFRGIRGGAFFSNQYPPSASGPNTIVPAGENSFIGFRVATVPEPSSLALAGIGLVGGLLIVRHRRGR